MVFPMKELLTPGEALILHQLLKLAGGVGCMKERSVLNEAQKVALNDLIRKGYVMLTSEKFVVVVPP
jgi:hypothetical protein